MYDCFKYKSIAHENTISINDLLHRNIIKNDTISTFIVQGTDYELLNIEMEDALLDFRQKSE